VSYREAVEDGVPVGRDLRGFVEYKPPCSICGASMHSWNYRRDVQYMCIRCRAKYNRILKDSRRKESI